jgi:hypothetical protein
MLKGEIFRAQGTVVKVSLDRWIDRLSPGSILIRRKTYMTEIKRAIIKSKKHWIRMRDDAKKGRPPEEAPIGAQCALCSIAIQVYKSAPSYLRRTGVCYFLRCPLLDLGFGCEKSRSIWRLAFSQYIAEEWGEFVEYADRMIAALEACEALW